MLPMPPLEWNIMSKLVAQLLPNLIQWNPFNSMPSVIEQQAHSTATLEAEVITMDECIFVEANLE